MRYCVFNTRDAWYISHSRDADSSVVNAKQWYGKKKDKENRSRHREEQNIWVVWEIRKELGVPSRAAARSQESPPLLVFLLLL